VLEKVVAQGKSKALFRLFESSVCVGRVFIVIIFFLWVPTRSVTPHNKSHQPSSAVEPDL